ncbi:hypothetical protein D2T29_12215 [Sinirhodobacter populi]|uniref:Uncharacterized protein n=1 Tax=Paenirhodobacter populi TaxID=2306993 RepID=A0A443KCA1_9RHOB|nr:hypothetical protein [Sinirhodobacter populi]RWR30431.1 hypothetical protein D2T29_12215 [Sinirhodobacter populi]
MELIIIICLVAFVAVYRGLDSEPRNKSKSKTDFEAPDPLIAGVQLRQCFHLADTGFYSSMLMAEEHWLRSRRRKEKS